MNQPKPRIAIPQPTSNDPEYNLRSFGLYLSAVEQSGGEPVSIELDQDPALIARLAATCSGVLLPGSPADVDPEKYGQAARPETAPPDILREACDELLLQDAFTLHKPLFGICYGHQSMNVWKGGTLVQHLQTLVDHEPGRTVEDAHSIHIASGARQLPAAFGADQGMVNSSHHQAVATPGDGLLPAAVATEDGTIEAVEAAEGFVVGVQWHPERTFATQSASRKLFGEFIQAARDWRLRENGSAGSTVEGSAAPSSARLAEGA